MKLALNELPGGQQSTHLLGGKRLAVERSAQSESIGETFLTGHCAKRLGYQISTDKMVRHHGAQGGAPFLCGENRTYVARCLPFGQVGGARIGLFLQ